jgi:3-hydroxyisobutyrate dehydrogenase-like beta-hydroxyacid dehydrogenase
MKLAMIGLGKMGIEMAGRLLTAGHELTVYNRTMDKARVLESRGARVASSPSEAVAGAEAVLTSLLNDAAVEAVLFGRDGILESLPVGAVHAGLSTISIDLAKRLDQEHRQRSQAYVGAPVIGRPEAASEAKLIVIAGGSASSIARVQPLFDAFARITFTAGAQPWQASLFKLCCNFMIASMLETFGEAQALIRKAGSDPKDFVALMSEFWGSPIYRNYGSLIANRAYDPPGFTLIGGIKDMKLVLDAATGMTVPLPLASLIRDQMLSALAAGNADLDWASFTDTAARNAGLPFKRA